MTGFILKNNVFRNIRKDYMVEFRNRYALNVSVSFSVISTLSIGLASGGMPVSGRIHSILFWIILFFSAMNGLAHIFIREEDQETALFLRLHARPDVILTSKLIFNICLFFILEIIVIPLFIFFLQIKVREIFLFIASAFAGGLAMSSSTTILAAIAAKAGGKGPLFTIISFPVVLPIIWVASNATAAAISSTGGGEITNILFLIAFSVVITALSYILFDYIWIED